MTKTERIRPMIVAAGWFRRTGFAWFSLRNRSRSISLTKPSAPSRNRSCRSSASGASRATTGKKVLAVDGRQWKEGQSSAGIADKARALYGERYAEFLDRVQAYAYFPYVVAPRRGEFHRSGEIAVRFEGAVRPHRSGRRHPVQSQAQRRLPHDPRQLSRKQPRCYGSSKTANALRSSGCEIRRLPTRQWHDLKRPHQRQRRLKAISTASSISSTPLGQPVSGRVGLWSKADSRMYFSDYTVTAAD